MKGTGHEVPIARRHVSAYVRLTDSWACESVTEFDEGVIVFLCLKDYTTSFRRSLSFSVLEGKSTYTVLRYWTSKRRRPGTFVPVSRR